VKFFLSSTLVLLGLIILAPDSSAQLRTQAIHRNLVLVNAAMEPAAVPMEPQICTPDCPFDNWTGELTSPILTLPNGCQIRVKYWHRKACNKWYDIQISGIQKLNVACNSLSTAALLEQAFVALVSATPSPFPYPPTSEGECSTDWRAVKASCFTYDDQTGWLTPCANFNCCLTSYRVCIVNGNRVVTKTGNTPPSNQNCDIPAGCEFTCPN
jgi:hypothetical protein